jgi:thymidylate synthase
MNNVDKEYFRLLDTILKNGRVKKNRTGINTIGIFGEQSKFDVDLNAFPILTTKKIWMKGIVHELLWFIKGDTNIKYLVDNDVHIWDEWAYKKYATEYQKLIDNEVENIYSILKNTHGVDGAKWTIYDQYEFIDKIKKDVVFAKKWGELGAGTYGGMWRNFPYHYSKVKAGFNDLDWNESYSVGGVDQLQKVINKLKTNPDDRRMIISAWHPYWVDHCALPPCHCMFHFNTEELTLEEREEIHNNKHGRVNFSKDVHMKTMQLNDVNIPMRKLNCLLYQRSNDFFLGVPFNITSYALLTAMIAHVTNMMPGTFTHTYGDAHIYENHQEQIKLQLSREPKELPKLWLNPAITDLFSFKYDDIKLISYDPHPAIKGEVAV